MKTLFNESKNGTQARATKFVDFASAIRFMKEKQNQGYIAMFPERIGESQFIVYTWKEKQ